jgi:hypothetical protein
MEMPLGPFFSLRVPGGPLVYPADVGRDSHEVIRPGISLGVIVDSAWVNKPCNPDDGLIAFIFMMTFTASGFGFCRSSTQAAPPFSSNSMGFLVPNSLTPNFPDDTCGGVTGQG